MIAFARYNTLTHLKMLLCLVALMMVMPLQAADNNRFLKIAGAEEYDLGPYFTHLEDPNSQYTFEDVSKPEVEKLFAEPRYDYINFSVSRSTHWLRLELRHIDKKERFEPRREWLLDVRRARLDEAELYIKRTDGSVEKMQSDLRIPYEDRPIKNVNSVFPITTERGETLTLYLRIKNENATYLPVHLRTATNFIRTNTSHDLLYGLFFGGMIVLILYNIFLLLATKDISYFYYVAYLVPVTMFEFIDIGYGIPLFEALPYLFHKHAILLYIWLSFLAGIMFTIQYLNIEVRSPLVYAFFKALNAFLIIAAVISYLVPYDVALLFTAYFCSSSSGLIVILGLYHWRKHNDTDAALMAGAWAFCVVGYIVYGGVATGWLPPNAFTIASLPLGTLLEATTLAFALGERIKRTQNQVLRARQRSIIHLKRFRSFFDNAAEGIYQLSLDGRLLSANNSMARILGFESQHTLLNSGKKAVGLLFSDRQRQWRSLIDTRQVRDEIELVDDQGTTRHAIHSAKLIRTPDGQPSHIEGSLIDLSERRQNEKAQRARLKERHEKELARSATDSKSGFLKNMSYQIRTPLNAIIGFSESLQQHALNRENRQYAVNSVIRNANHLLQLVNDILDFSKIEAGKMVVEAIDIDLMALIRQVQTQNEVLAKEKQIYFRVDCRFPLPARIKSDPTRIRQILNNLCSNAIKYTPAGTVKLIVRWDAINQHMCFDVEDSGIGLTPAEIRKLLGQNIGDTSLNASVTGGLGIAITLHLVKLLGGQLQVDSRKGFGSRFTATIACKAIGKEEWIKQAQAPAAAANAKGVPQLMGKVLLAEDNVVNQKLILRLIGKTGATVTLAENGLQAVELARAHHFDLVLMDINMPIMDGLTATRLMQEEGFPSPILALTAEHGAEEIQACIAAGCLGHLSKPIDVPDFYSKLSHYLAPANPTLPIENQQ